MASPGVKRAGFWQYVKRAFVQHWNLLAFGAGVAAGALSGHADVVIPLVAASEMVYLAGLASHPRFQAAVDASTHQAAKAEAKATVTEPALQRIFVTLDPRSRARFEELRKRCRELRQLALGPAAAEGPAEVASLHLEGINRLLWVFLKLLYSKHALERFLATTDEKEIRESIADLENRLESLGPVAEDTPAEVRNRRSLVDTLASANLRLNNLARARENHEFILIELERIDSKITSIAELAVNRQDPNFVTTEVDGVAATMEQTERAMTDLQLVSGIDQATAPPPSFLDEKLDVQ